MDAVNSELTIADVALVFGCITIAVSYLFCMIALSYFSIMTFFYLSPSSFWEF